MSRPDSGTMGVAVFAAVMSLANLAIIAVVANHLPPPCKRNPTPTPACKADECCGCDPKAFATKAELVVVRNGLQERIEATEARCACPKCCTAAAGPVDECEPTPAKQPPEVLPTPKPKPHSRLKRSCRTGCCR